MEYLLELPLELQHLIISFSSFEWRMINKEYKQMADLYLLYDYRIMEDKVNLNSILDASQKGYTGIIALLIQDKRINLTIDDQFVHLLCKRGYLEILKILLENNNIDPSSNHNEAIIEASSNGYSEIVKLLLQDPRVDPSDRNNQAIRNSSIAGHVEIVKLLLKDPRVDPSDNENEAIRNCSASGNILIVKLLLEDPRVDPSDKNNQAINWAIGQGHTKIVKLLLKDRRVSRTAKKGYILKQNIGFDELSRILSEGNNFIVILKMIILLTRLFIASIF